MTPVLGYAMLSVLGALITFGAFLLGVRVGMVIEQSRKEMDDDDLNGW